MIEDNLRDWIDFSEKSYSNKNWKESILRFNFILNNFNNIPVRIYIRLSSAYRKNNQIELSEKILREGLFAHPESVCLHIEYARYYIYQENWRKALIFFLKSYRLNSKCSDYSKSQLTDFILSSYMAGKLTIYSVVVSEAVKNHPDDKVFFIYMLHAFCLKDIERNKFDDAKIKCDLINRFIDSDNKYYFSLSCLSRKIKVKQSLIYLNNEKKISELRGMIVRKSPARAFGEDLIGISDYLENIKILRNNLRYNLVFNNFLNIINNIDRIIINFDNLCHIKYSKEYQYLVNNLSDLVDKSKFDSSWLPSEGWLILANILATRMFVKNSKILRDLAVEEILTNPPSFNKIDYFCIQYIRACMDIGSEDYKDLIDFPSLEKTKYRDIFYFSELYNGNRKAVIDYFSGALNSEEELFGKYLSGKSIAVVGPVNSGILQGKEIDSYDVVIRFNYRGLDRYDLNIFGTKTTVSYYINSTFKEISHELLSIHMDKLEYIAHQRISPRTIPAFKDIKVPMRYMYEPWLESKRAFFKSNPNAIQKCLFDILRFSTGPIKVFNANLWIDDTPNPAYREKSGIVPSDFIWHDFFSNFIFLKRLYKYKIIDVDSILSSILSMSVDEYAKEMDLRYCF